MYTFEISKFIFVKIFEYLNINRPNIYSLFVYLRIYSTEVEKVRDPRILDPRKDFHFAESFGTFPPCCEMHITYIQYERNKLLFDLIWVVWTLQSPLNDITYLT